MTDVDLADEVMSPEPHKNTICRARKTVCFFGNCARSKGEGLKHSLVLMAQWSNRDIIMSIIITIMCEAAQHIMSRASNTVRTTNSSGRRH